VVASQALVGTLGTVTIKVRGGDRPGEVRVVVEGIAHYYIAYCEHAVPVGKQVLVINVRGARQIDVEPWEELGRDADDVSGTTEGM
jgi:membrane protein implicated in regulation of membrane protease activity